MTFIHSAVVIILFYLSGNVANAKTLYGITNTSNQLITIDSTTGARSPVGMLTSTAGPTPQKPVGLAFRGMHFTPMNNECSQRARAS